MKSTPEPPGPPGFTSSEPSLSPVVAGWRTSANSMDAAEGSVQSSGAFAVAH
jgi:hypothetical protein